MKKFMKFCFIAAMLLIIVGGALYLLGGEHDGREAMDRMLSRFGGNWRNPDVDIAASEKMYNEPVTTYSEEWLDAVWGGETYEIEEAVIFDNGIRIWQGNMGRQRICQGYLTMLDMEIGGSMVEIRDSDDEYVYVEGTNVGKLQAYEDGGILYVTSVRPSNLADEFKNSVIVLYLPKDCTLESMYVSLGAGQIEMEDLAVGYLSINVGAGQLLMENMTLGNLDISLGAGEVKAEDIEAGWLSAQVGMGNLEYSGSLHDGATIECSMGNVVMDLEGDEADFDYDLSCVAGNLKIGDESSFGAVMEKSIYNVGSHKYMEIRCSMGNVEVNF